MQLMRKPTGVFYGWWIVGSSLLIAMFTSGIVLHGFTAIFEPIADEFEWSYTQISLASSIRGAEVGLFAPLVGILVDRWGPRRIIFGGLLIVGMGLLLLSRTTSLLTFYLSFALVATGVSACSSTALMTTVAHWFRKRVGLVMGIVACGWGLGGLVIPVLVWLIDMYQWRMAVLILALGFLAFILPLSLVHRHKPEQYGYLPDGDIDIITPETKASSVSTVSVDIKLKQAIRSRTSWHLSFTTLFHLVIMIGVLTHIMPYLSSIGIPRASAAVAATALPMLSIVGRLSSGWLGDKIDKRWLRAIAFVMVSLGLLCFQYTATVGTWLLVPFVILTGIGYGSNNPLRTAMVREFFGRSHFGAIHGFIVSIGMLGNITGAPLVGWVYDHWGSYRSIWLILAAVSLVGAVTIATTPPLIKRDQTESTLHR